MRTQERTRRGLLALAGALVAALALAQAAPAAIPVSLHTAGALNSGCLIRDAADDETTVDTEKPYVFCDDGVPSNGFPSPGPGGTQENVGGVKAITVPAKYDDGASTFEGLPLKASDADDMAGADGNGDIALDVDISLPATAPPAGGYPMVVMMHGCCGGNKTNWESPTIDPGNERWHYNNAWFASRGYVVLTYTARGFVSAANPTLGQPHLAGSTGETQLDSRSFEINDYQALACNVLAASEAQSFDDVSPLTNTAGVDVKIDPSKVVTTGGSYGGGFSWLSLTDPKWECNADTGAATTPMSLAATAPRYGWTDLAYTLVPNGTHRVSGSVLDLPQDEGCDTGAVDINVAPCTPAPPTGIPKTSIVTGLFLSGNLVGSSHTTFPPEILEAFGCLQGTYPFEDNPACDNTLATILPRFLRERSAYYQNLWFNEMDTDASLRVPIFNAGTLTDPLFPAYENRRMARRILNVFPGYPIKEYYGDYQHFVQNKTKEWADLCTSGPSDRHACTLADYPGGNVNAGPNNPVTPGDNQSGLGATTRLNRFVDNYAQPTGGYPPATPDFDVTAALQVCPENAGELGVAADEPGLRFTEDAFAELAPNTLNVNMTGAQTTTSSVANNTHGSNADPVANSLANGGRCPKETSVAGAGVASYTSDALGAGIEATMIGSTVVTADIDSLTGSSDGLQLNARLYDLFPNGTAVMVDRGPHRVTDADVTAGETTWELHGNGWRFEPGHRIRIELAQDDQAFVKSTTTTSSLNLGGVEMAIPVQETFGSSVPGGPDPKPTTPTTPSSPPAAVTPKKKCKKGFKLKKGKCKKKKKKK